MELVYTILLVLILMASAWIGWAIRKRIHQRHVSREALDSILLLMGMLVTFSALVLGLLTSGAKQRFDGLNDNMSAFATSLIELDHRMRLYGSEGDPIRASLRTYTAAAIADSWPGETPPTGQYPRFGRSPASAGIERLQLGQMLSQIDVALDKLDPTDDYHRRLAERLRDRAEQAIQQRWNLIFAAQSTISWPFLLILTAWLSIIFAMFGMASPPGRLVYAVVALSAVSIASPLYLILDYSSALDGLLMISSEPLRAALNHMDGPE